MPPSRKTVWHPKSLFLVGFSDFSAISGFVSSCAVCQSGLVLNSTMLPVLFAFLLHCLCLVRHFLQLLGSLSRVSTEFQQPTYPTLILELWELPHLVTKLLQVLHALWFFASTSLNSIEARFDSESSALNHNEDIESNNFLQQRTVIILQRYQNIALSTGTLVPQGLQQTLTEVQVNTEGRDWWLTDPKETPWGKLMLQKHPRIVEPRKDKERPRTY